MSDFYKKLVDNVTQHWGREGFILVPKTDVTNEGEFVIPPDMIPSGEVVEFPRGAEYIENITRFLKGKFFKWLFLFPPWGSWRELPENFKETYRGWMLHEACLRECVRVAEFPIHVGAILPEDFFVGNRAARMREALFGVYHSQSGPQTNFFKKENIGHTWPCWPELVISHDHSAQLLGLLGLHRQFRTGTLFFQIGGEEPEAIRFFRYMWSEEERERARQLSDLAKLMKQGGGQTTHGYIIRGGLQPGSKLSFDLHSPATEEKRRELEGLGELRRLENVFEIVEGLHRTRDSNLLHSQQSEGTVPAISGRQINREGTILFDQAEYFTEADGIPLLQEGDFCMRRIGDFSARGSVIFAVVLKGDPPATFLNNLLVLRPKTKLSELEQEFYAAYLRSDIACHFLKAKGTRINLNRTNLMNLPFPKPSKDLKIALGQLANVEETLDSWKSEITLVRNELFGFSRITESRERIYFVGRRLRERIEIGRQVDSLSYRVSTLFPFPISFRWRTVLSSNPNLEGYRTILSCSEVLACYLAMLVLAVTRKHGKTIKYMETIADRITTAGRGTNYGDWLAILREARDATEMKKLSKEVQFVELFSFLDDPEVDQAFQALKSARDDEAHDRGPKSGPDIERAFSNLLEKLKVALEGTEFLSDYRLRWIEDLHFDSLSGMTNYNYRDLQGDHPLVSPHTDGLNQGAELEKGSLYAVDSQGELYLLRPFMNRLYCQQCGNYSTFYLDRYDSRKNVIQLKSMEHGHPLKSDEMILAFKKVGLIRKEKKD